jgi:hypothetical protein
VSPSLAASDDLTTAAKQSLAAITCQLAAGGFHVQGPDAGSHMVHAAGATGTCARGLVQVAGDPALIWRCPLTPGGLSHQQIAATITAALRYQGATQ